MKNYGSPSREAGFTKAAELFKANGGKVIVETGCYWSEPQGGSTIHLAELATETNAIFHSVDINPEHIQFARNAVNNNPRVIFHRRDSLEFLREFPHKISLLYLDAFDFIEDKPDLLATYNAAELGAALGQMEEHSVILMDDWNWGNEVWRKCRLSRELLLHRNWKCEVEDYQLLFSR